MVADVHWFSCECLLYAAGHLEGTRGGGGGGQIAALNILPLSYNFIRL